MNILVTGGAGFIGSHIVDAYLKLGHKLSIIDNLSAGSELNINRMATFYKGDITNQSFMAKIIQKEKPELVCHLAAHIHVGRSVQDPLFDANINILGTITLMEALAKAACCKKIIFSSTGGAMYGNKKTPFSETMMPSPLSPYGVSKCSSEFYLGYYHDRYKIPYIALRYANVYGPRQNPQGEAGVISIFSKNMIEHKQPIINGDGKQTRDYVFVDDAVNANVLALENPFIGALNIGTGIETDVNKIFYLVNIAFSVRFKPKHGPARPGEQKTSALSFEKAKEILGWSPTVTLKEGIEKTVQWFKKHPDRV